MTKKITPDIFQLSCKADPIDNGPMCRFDIATPFKVGHYLYSTNGIIVVRKLYRKKYDNENRTFPPIVETWRTLSSLKRTKTILPDPTSKIRKNREHWKSISIGSKGVIISEYYVHLLLSCGIKYVEYFFAHSKGIYFQFANNTEGFIMGQRRMVG